LNEQRKRQKETLREIEHVRTLRLIWSCVVLITYSIVGVVQIWWKILACWTEETADDFALLRNKDCLVKGVAATRRLDSPTP
jgi:hypothetical protein